MQKHARDGEKSLNVRRRAFARTHVTAPITAAPATTTLRTQEADHPPPLSSSVCACNENNGHHVSRIVRSRVRSEAHVIVSCVVASSSSLRASPPILYYVYDARTAAAAMRYRVMLACVCDFRACNCSVCCCQCKRKCMQKTFL